MRRHKPWLPKELADRVRSPRATQMHAPLGTGTVKITLHNEGVDRGGRDSDGKASSRQLARYVVARGIEYHTTWNVLSGNWTQMVAFDQASQALLNGGAFDGVGCDAQGSINIQVCVVGFGLHPFTDSPLRGAHVLALIADSWGVPLLAPNSFTHPRRSEAMWRKDGLHGHSMAPGNDHTDPGPIDVHTLVTAARRQLRAHGGGQTAH